MQRVTITIDDDLVGGHLGDAWGSSRWTANSAGAAAISGSFGLFEPFDPFAETGSFFEGVQTGYDYRLPNRFVLGAALDASFPAFPDRAGISIGGSSTFTSPVIGAESYGETVLSFGTVRGRVGYAPGDWLVYATGGLAWTYDQAMLTQLGNGATDSALPVAIRLDGRSRRRGPYRAALDGDARISVHRLRQQRRDLSDRRAALRRGFVPARSCARG